MPRIQGVSQGNYRSQVQRFLRFCAKPIDAIDENDVRKFLHHVRYDRGLVVESVNYYHTCIKFFFEAVLEKPWNARRIPRLRGYHSVPVILSTAEVHQILEACESLKQHVVLSMVYGSGLRNGEVCRLQVQDIRSETMQVFVRTTKRNRERYTILAESSLKPLREYWRNYGRPDHWLFPSERTDSHIPARTVRNYLERACARANISKKITLHTVRHCFATHFLEAGHSIHDLKPLLGHSSLATTARYVQLARPGTRNLKSPLDCFDGDQP